MTPEQIEKWARASGFDVEKDGSINDGIETAADFRRELAEFARLVSADTLVADNAALAAIQDVLEAAYHRCYLACCGRPGMECCGSPVQMWNTDDQHIMNTLGPVEKRLRDALRAEAAKEAKNGS